MEFKLISKDKDEFPRLWSIGDSGEFKLFESPFGNCQSFSLIQARYIKYMEADDIKPFLKSLAGIVKRKQMIIDLNNDISDDIINKLKQYTINIVSTPYISTNGSKMVMHIIQLSAEKIFE